MTLPLDGVATHAQPRSVTPLAAALHEEATLDDYAALIGRFIDDGRTDGWPVIPPTAEAAATMVAASGRGADDILGRFAAGEPVTVAGVADQAVLAGCLPEYMPVVLAVFEALLDPAMGTDAALRSTAGLYPFVIVGGPIRSAIDLNCGRNAFGPGRRANSTIGRAIRLGLINLAGATNRSTLGSAYQYVCVVGEDEEASPWGPLNRSLGAAEGESTALVMWATELRQVLHHNSEAVEELLRNLVDPLRNLSRFSSADFAATPRERALLVLPAGFHSSLRAEGWSRRRVQEFVLAEAWRRAGDARAAGLGGSSLIPSGAADEDRVSFYDGAEDVLCACVGPMGAEGQSACARVLRSTMRTIRLGTGASSASAGTGPVAKHIATAMRYVERGLTDGMPVIPPTAASLGRMIEASGRRGDELLGRFDYSDAVATVKDVALNAVMAGCRPEYMPVVLAAFTLMIESGGGNSTSVGGPASWIVVNGPIREAIGINCGSGVLGPGHRANATIGRALRLGLMNIARYRPDSLDKAVQGQAYKYTCIIGENEEGSPWEPFHTAQGFAPHDSTVSLFSGGRGPREVDLSGSGTPEHFVAVLADELSGLHVFQSPAAHPEPYVPNIGGALILLGGDHRALLREAGWSRRRLQESLVAHVGRRLGDIRAAGFAWPGRFGPERPDDDWIPMNTDPEAFRVVAAGGPGGHSMTVRAGGRRPLTRKVEFPNT